MNVGIGTWKFFDVIWKRHTENKNATRWNALKLNGAMQNDMTKADQHTNSMITLIIRKIIWLCWFGFIEGIRCVYFIPFVKSLVSFIVTCAQCARLWLWIRYVHNFSFRGIILFCNFLFSFLVIALFTVIGHYLFSAP